VWRVALWVSQRARVPGQGCIYGSRAGTGARLMHVQFGDYHVRDVEFVAAFDVDAKKVGSTFRAI